MTTQGRPTKYNDQILIDAKEYVESFVKVDKGSLPMKVWSDCAKCPKQDHCDETALVFETGA